MTELNSKRERARALIRTLLAKTVSNGCTEEEALAASAKANELLLQYDLSIEDVQEIRDDTYGATRKRYGSGQGRTRRWHEALDAAHAVSVFTGTRAFAQGHELIFFGRRQDGEIAHFLIDLFINACESEWQAFRRRGVGDTSVRGRKSFLRGMILRIIDRLERLAAQREDSLKAAQTGRELIVVKAQIVEERLAAYFEQSNAKIQKGRKARRHFNPRSDNFAAGVAAGDRVNITAGIEG